MYEHLYVENIIEPVIILQTFYQFYQFTTSIQCRISKHSNTIVSNWIKSSNIQAKAEVQITKQDYCDIALV